jgi:hypothetical protein
LTSHV